MLLMSATVLDATQLVTSLGLDPTVGDYIQLPCIFPPENRPVYVSHLDMSFKARDESWPRMRQAVENILNHHKNEKGFLLCPSDKMLKYIQKGLSPSNAARLILAHGEGRDAKYNEHIQSKSPTVLAASGFWEGADLKGDSSRFQIIPQLPRAHWSGQVKARAQKDPTWYRHKTMTKLIQGMGRSVRTEEDYATTYILDGDFRSELNRKFGSLVPDWLREAVHLIES